MMSAACSEPGRIASAPQGLTINRAEATYNFPFKKDLCPHDIAAGEYSVEIQSSFCFPRKSAAACSSFTSPSLGGVFSSPERSTIDPVISPEEIIG